MLSVIIPALNSAKTIGHTLSSIFSNKFPESLFEVLVIDNGSTDNTVEIAKEFPVRIYACEKRGIGPPRNVGIKKAKGEIACFTDSDCIVENQWLGKIFDFFESNPEADGVGGPTLPYQKNVQNKIQELSGEIFIEDQGFPMKIKKVEFGSFNGLLYGANCAFKKNVLVSVGGFEEPGGSALELSWRLAARKKLLFFNPDMIVFHTFPNRLEGLLRQQFRWGIDNAKLLRHKNSSVKDLLFGWYLLGKSSLSLFSLTNYSKKLLRLVQLMAFQVGRMRGYYVKSEIVSKRFAQ